MNIKRRSLIAFACLVGLFFIQDFDAYAQDWSTVAKNLVRDYQGKIISIEELDSSTCWAILAPGLSNIECVKMAENIGYYIRNTTGGVHGKTPSVHVFKGPQRHIAVARPSGMQYIGELDIKIWR